MNERIQIKTLFYQLVSAVGGLDAAGQYLGITFQRVGQLQNPTCADMPTILQIVTLESVIGQDIVTGALARLARNGSITASDPEKEIGDVHIALGNVHHLHRTGVSPKKKHAAALVVVREAQEVADMFAKGVG